MSEYYKIDTVFKRDPNTKHKTLLLGDYSRDEFAYLANNEWVFTEKVDGTNVRVMIDKTVSGVGRIKFGGKTDAASLPTPLSDRLRERIDGRCDELQNMFPEGACLYGEGYGAKIQKGGGNYRSDQDFVLFDVKIGDWWLKRADVEDIAHKLGIECVPVIGIGKLSLMVEWAAQGFKSMWGNFQAEGIVARPSVELKTRNGDRIITKIKCRDFAQIKEAAACTTS